MLRITYCLACYLCSKLFKTHRAFVKHFAIRHSAETLDHERVKFVDHDSEHEVKIPELQLMNARTAEYKKGYLPWLAGLTEQINASLHPCFPGRWYKVDFLQVPLDYFQHFVGRMGCYVDSIRRVPHKRPPTYATSTKRISYKLFDYNEFVEAIEEQGIIKLKKSAFYSGTTEIHQAQISLTDEIEAAMQCDPWSTGKDVDKDKRDSRPTLHASIEIEEGQGRITREVEVIWWPELYTNTQHGQLTLRFFLDKVAL